MLGDPSKHTMDHLEFNMCSFIEKYIGLKKVKHIFGFRPTWQTRV